MSGPVRIGGGSPFRKLKGEWGREDMARGANSLHSSGPPISETFPAPYLPFLVSSLSWFHPSTTHRFYSLPPSSSHQQTHLFLGPDPSILQLSPNGPIIILLSNSSSGNFCVPAYHPPNHLQLHTPPSWLHLPRFSAATYHSPLSATWPNLSILIHPSMVHQSPTGPLSRLSPSLPYTLLIMMQGFNLKHQ